SGAAACFVGHLARRHRKAFMAAGPLSHPMSHVNPAELAYGSDKTGLVWGYLFKPGQPPRQIECDAALGWLATSGPADSSEFVWLHLSLSNAAAERWMRQSLQLADAFYESLHEGVGSTRLEVEG